MEQVANPAPKSARKLPKDRAAVLQFALERNDTSIFLILSSVRSQLTGNQPDTLILLD